MCMYTCVCLKLWGHESRPVGLEPLLEPKFGESKINIVRKNMRNIQQVLLSGFLQLIRHKVTSHFSATKIHHMMADNEIFIGRRYEHVLRKKLYRMLVDP